MSTAEERNIATKTEVALPENTETTVFRKYTTDIAEIRTQCTDLVVTTKEGYKTGNELKNKLVKLRTGMEAVRKEVKAPLLERCKLIDKTAGQIEDDILSIEEPLRAKLKVVDDAIEKARREKVEAERKKIEDEQRAKLEAEQAAEKARRDAEEAERQKKLEAERAELEAQRQKLETERLAAEAERKKLEEAQAAELLPGRHRDGERQRPGIATVWRRQPAVLHVLFALELDLAVQPGHRLGSDDVVVEHDVCGVYRPALLQPVPALAPHVGTLAVTQAGGLRAAFRAVGSQVLAAVRVLAIHANGSALLGVEVPSPGQRSARLEGAVSADAETERGAAQGHGVHERRLRHVLDDVEQAGLDEQLTHRADQVRVPLGVGRHR